MDNQNYWMWLNSIPDVGPIRAKILIDIFGAPQAVFEAGSRKLLKVEGIGHHVIESIESSKSQENLEQIQNRINRLKEYNIDIVDIKSPWYPDSLKNIYASPIILYVKGDLMAQDNNSIAIVGARNATQYGLKVAYDFAKQLAKKGITVISGMARGIDTAAHKGALDGGGRTIGVLGCGIDVVYPPENKELMKRVIQNGAIISEFPLGTIPDARNFPQRNRIISGISRGTLIVEARKNSGSLITADFALEQGKEVYAVPGPIYTVLSSGTNNLIKQGAKLVTCIDDILEEMNIECVSNETIETNLNLSADENAIYDFISNMPTSTEYILKSTGLSISKLNTLITMLELKGAIKQLPGNLLIRA